mgnify:CR=1 FL=1
MERCKLQDLGNKLREQEGLDVLAKRVISKITFTDYIIDGIRNTAEVKKLREEMR